MRRTSRSAHVPGNPADRPARRTSRSALGLVEVVIAALVLAGAVAVVFQALGVGVRGTEQIGEELAGAQLASDLLDLLAGLGRARLVAVPEAAPGDAATALGAALRAAGDDGAADALVRAVDKLAVPEGYQARVTIEALAATSDGIPAGKLVRVTVAVRWAGPGKATRGVKLARLVTDEVGL